MPKSFKIKTAFILCLAILFKLFLLNMAALAETQSSSSTYEEYSSIHLKKKRRIHDQTVVRSMFTAEQSVEELTEENSENEEDSNQLKKVTLLFVVVSFLNQMVDSSKSTLSFDFIKSQLQPKKFLALSVIRI